MTEELTVFGEPMLRADSASDTFFVAVAGNLSSTGQNCIGVAKGALSALTSGDGNSAFGYMAGASVTSGDENTFIGVNAGAGGSQIATVVNTVALGANSFTEKSNQVVIGNALVEESVLFGNIRSGHNGVSVARVYAGSENYFYADGGPAGEPTGSGNVAIGKSAGEAIDTCVASVYIGKDAGKSVTTGVDHTFVGAGAGEAQVSGVGCVAVGRLAGKTSSTATNWTAIGDTALEFNNADGAVALGYGAGRDQATGAGGVYLGTYAGGYSASADHTTVVGTEALGGPAYGDDNTIGGWRAGHVMTGERNTGWGAEAQRSNTSGSDNTAVGFRAGFQISTGSGNTFLGRSAGHDANQKVDAVNSMALGNLTWTTKDNQVVIGNTSITETILRGKVLAGAETSNSNGHVVIGSVKSTVANPSGAQLVLEDYTPMSVGCGGQLVFRGFYNGSSLTEAGAIQAQKSNGTNGNYNFALTLHTRDNGGDNTEKLRISNDGTVLQKPLPLPAGGAQQASLRLTAAEIGIYVGSGAPTISAAQGSLYLRNDASSANTRVYVNVDGGTSWAGLSASA